MRYVTFLPSFHYTSIVFVVVLGYLSYICVHRYASVDGVVRASRTRRGVSVGGSRRTYVLYCRAYDCYIPPFSLANAFLNICHVLLYSVVDAS